MPVLWLNTSQPNNYSVNRKSTTPAGIYYISRIHTMIVEPTFTCYSGVCFLYCICWCLTLVHPSCKGTPGCIPGIQRWWFPYGSGPSLESFGCKSKRKFCAWISSRTFCTVFCAGSCIVSITVFIFFTCTTIRKSRCDYRSSTS